MVITLKKTIKIKFVDFYSNYKDNYIYKLLDKKYNIVISDNPDYIICSQWGYKHLKYDCIRIFYTGENLRPNFNHFDYGIGFDNISFEDRYLRVPIYLMLNQYMPIYNIAETKHLDKDNYKVRNKFCNMVVSNGLNNERITFFHDLSKYKQVDSGGRLLNNVGGPVDSKLEFQKQYKFSLAFENSVSNGYTTEKIIDAFASGGIPIYWGDPLVENIFNKKAFINANNFKTNKELIDYIKKVDNDDNLYMSYIKEPMLNNQDYLKDEQEKIKKFIYNIFDQDIEKARRRSDGHFVLQEKKGLILVDKIINASRPILKIKSNIKNKLVK